MKAVCLFLVLLLGTAAASGHDCVGCHAPGHSTHTRPRRQSPRPFHVLFVGKGHYFRFLEPIIQRVMHPRPVTFSRDVARGRDRSPDLVVLSVDTATPDILEADYGRARVLGCVAEPTTDTNRVAAFGAAFAARGRPALVMSTVARHAVLPFVRYYPGWAMSIVNRRHANASDLVNRKTPASVANALKAKTQFACFMYSHASRGRDRIFDVISDKYKPVIPLGAAKQDRRLPWMPAPALDRFVRNETLTFMDLAVERYKSCKFVIAGESWMLDGYITEKLVNAMLAHAVPIYWGPPDVVHTFNAASFINAGSLSEDALVAEVRRLDQNDTAYALKLLEPWFPGDALPRWLHAHFQEEIFRTITHEVIGGETELERDGGEFKRHGLGFLTHCIEVVHLLNGVEPEGRS